MNLDPLKTVAERKTMDKLLDVMNDASHPSLFSERPNSFPNTGLIDLKTNLSLMPSARTSPLWLKG